MSERPEYRSPGFRVARSEGIKPVMTPDQWERVRSGCDDITSHYYNGEKGAVIAACNDELPDSDPRKITRERIALLRDPAYRETEAARFLEALASYLPPE
jgi:hypothetical protein